MLLNVAHGGVRLGRKVYLVDMSGGEKRAAWVAVSNTAPCPGFDPDAAEDIPPRRQCRIPLQVMSFPADKEVVEVRAALFRSGPI